MSLPGFVIVHLTIFQQKMQNLLSEAGLRMIELNSLFRNQDYKNCLCVAVNIHPVRIFGWKVHKVHKVITGRGDPWFSKVRFRKA
jgi:hypothetical protein